MRWMECKNGYAIDRAYEYLPAEGSIDVTMPTDSDIGGVRLQLIADPAFVPNWDCVSYNQGEVIYMSLQDGYFEPR